MFAPVSCEVAYDYFADPHNRPVWQSSLARVEDVDGDVRVGQTWVDVTKPGLRPRMETTEADRPHRWTEIGTWGGITAELTLTFTPAEGGCEIAHTQKVRGRGLFAPIGLVVDRLAPLAVRTDLRKAVGLLAKSA